MNAVPLERHKLPYAARLMVIEQVIHQPMEPPGQPVDVASPSFSAKVASDEQPIVGRVVTVGEEWRKLDLFWLNGAPLSCLYLDNIEGTGRQVVPTDDEVAATDRRVVEVATANLEPFALVRPARTVRFEPTGSVYLRCQEGTAKVKYSAVPQ